MIETVVIVTQSTGLDAPTTAALVQLTSGFHSRISLSAKGREVNAKSIMGVLLLAAAAGTRLQLRVDGEDAAAATQAICDFFAAP